MLNQVISSLKILCHPHPGFIHLLPINAAIFPPVPASFPISTMEYSRFSHYVPCSYFCFSACLF